MTTISPDLLPLESGDHLTRDEFHRRYLAHPEIKRAELVNGVVYVASPISGWHGKSHGVLSTWMGTYAIDAIGFDCFIDTTMRLDATEVQPDASILRVPPQPGDGEMRTDGYIYGPPLLAAEVAASSASYDLHTKLEAYQRAGVQEYIVWQTLQGRFSWFRLRDGVYVPLRADANGVIESEVCPGLRMPVDDLLAGRYRSVLSALRHPKRARRGRAASGRDDIGTES